jgi:plastocyanin
VTFEGTPPKMTPVKMTADKKCNAMHAEPVMFQSVLANERGMLKNVFVYVKEGLGSGPYASSKLPVTMTQKGCMYEPHVMGIQTGQTLRIENSDPLLHNVHSLPKINKSFNFAQPKKGMTTETSFTNPEVMVKVKCDVHPWMGCFIGVLDHPFFGVTDENGTCKIQNLPPGKYVLSAWHEEFGTIEKEITIVPNETISTVFTFAAK